MMMNGQKTQPAPPPREMTEAKVVAANAEEGNVDANQFGIAGRLGPIGYSRKREVAQVALRLMCMAASVIAMSVMVTAHQVSTASFFGFELHLYSKWSFSYSFEYLFGISAATTCYSLLQLLVTGSRVLRKSPVIPSRDQAWLIFGADQVLAYLMLSAGSAASGVTNLNRTGIRHTALPNFCKSLHYFCDHIAISIGFTFLASMLLAASAIQEVIWLSKY